MWGGVTELSGEGSCLDGQESAHAQEAADERCGQQHTPSGGIGIGYSIEQFRPVHLHSLRPPPIHYRAVSTFPATTPGQ